MITTDMLQEHPHGRSVLYSVEDGIATVLLNRPDRLNAFTDDTEVELVECFDRADADDTVKVVIITGVGRAFCAGMDLASSGDPRDAFREWRTSSSAPPNTQFEVVGDPLPVRRDGGGRVVLRIFASTKPVIAAINGHAVGVGITMTLPADFRIAAEGAKVAFPFVRRGLVPESCSSWFLPRLVGQQRAADWILTGRTFNAEEAYSAGLFLSLHPVAEVLQAARELAGRIVDTGAPASASLSRRLLWAMMTASHPMEAHELETEALNARGISADAQEGISAFVEKRPAGFSDPPGADTPAALVDLLHRGYRAPGRPAAAWNR
jgi:enoyl-CoA hydratase/carnithine racemase